MRRAAAAPSGKQVGMQPFETIYIDSMVAACNGGGGPLGHPKVYLNLSADGQVECPYCSRLFIHQSKRSHGHAVGGHVVETAAPGGSHEARAGDHTLSAAPAPSGGSTAPKP
jgi:uncharacterized Zn-finger protein